MPCVGESRTRPLDEIQEFLTGVRHAPEPDRVLATVLFTDIVNSTERAAELGDRRWLDMLGRHDAAVRQELDRFRGREVKTTGDGFLATFDGPARAVRCASAIVQAVRPLGLDIRAGLHTGECELVGDDVGGIAVHIGQRVSALAGPGEVLASSTVRDLVAGSGWRSSRAASTSCAGCRTSGGSSPSSGVERATVGVETHGPRSTWASTDGARRAEAAPHRPRRDRQERPVAGHQLQGVQRRDVPRRRDPGRRAVPDAPLLAGERPAQRRGRVRAVHLVRFEVPEDAILQRQPWPHVLVRALDRDVVMAAARPPDPEVEIPRIAVPPDPADRHRDADDAVGAGEPQLPVPIF